MHNHPNNSWTVFGALGALFSGLAGALAEVPAGTWLSVLGVLGSIAMPIAVELIRARNDREKAALRAKLESLTRIQVDRASG